jgi:hypothetical protein
MPRGEVTYLAFATDLPANAESCKQYWALFAQVIPTALVPAYRLVVRSGSLPGY